MKEDRLVTKMLGLQHPHDKVVEMLHRFGHSGKLLDAAAGPGVLSHKMKKAGFEVVAADINPQFFSAPGITCEKSDLNQDLPFSDRTFDFILCSNAIEHLENPHHFIRESYRVLKEKGKFLITTPNILSLKSRVANLLVGFNLFKGRPSNEVDLYRGGDHIHLTSYYELRIALHRNGFQILDATTHQFSPTAMMFFFLFPFIYLITLRAFKRERNPRQKERNKEIIRHITSLDLIFGKKLFVIAEKNPQYLKTI